MPGPPPGHGALPPSVRARTNKTTTAAELEVLPLEERAAIVVPELPADRVWDPKTSEFWVAAWQSPMRLEWDPGDTHKVLMVAYVLDEFYAIATNTAGDGSATIKPIDRALAMTKLAKSVIDLTARLGLDPYARRSLQWLMVQTERAEADTAHTREQTAAAKAERAAAAEASEARKRRGLGALE